MRELFCAYGASVLPEWVDYNGHMHDASYAIALSDANEELFRALDLSKDYRTRSGAAFYTVETHLRYVAECIEGQRLSAHTLLVSAGPKKIHIYTELFADEVMVATGESVYLHVDSTQGRTTPMPPDRQAKVDELYAAHASLPRPKHLFVGHPGLQRGVADGSQALCGASTVQKPGEEPLIGSSSADS
jgi:acyl-CoA thioesterase FadM